MKMIRSTLGLIGSLLLLMIPGPVNAQGSAALSGILNCQEQITLPVNAIVTVQIAELRGSGAPQVVAEQRFTTNGAQPPFRYTIAYDPGRINTSAQYTLQSNISVDGQVRFTTNQVYRVITGGAPVSDVNILLVTTGAKLPQTSGGSPLLMLSALLLLGGLAIFMLRRALGKRTD
jgi:putative lipoprotein